MVRREQGRACKHLFKYVYLNPPFTPPTSWKTFLVSKFQLSNVKKCGVGGFDMLDMFVMLFCACETWWLKELCHEIQPQ